MIINIRGTSGSGKSTMVREIMDQYDHCEPVHEEGRRQPIAYHLTRHGMPDLVVLGHYETPCGGCDTIMRMDDVFEMVDEAHAAGHDVLFEGLLISGEARRALDLVSRGMPLVTVHLDLDIGLCVDSVNERRRAKRGPDAPPVRERNTVAKHRAAQLACTKIREAGGRVETFTERALALQLVRELLDL